jgi:hypothetical protein
MGQTRKTARATLPAAIGKVLKRLHYPLDVILPRDVEEFGEIVPLTLEVHRKPAVSPSTSASGSTIRARASTYDFWPPTAV